MILSALVDYYEHLLVKGKVGQSGWSLAKVSYAILIDETGRVRKIQSLLKTKKSGKKVVFAPVDRFVPMQKRRSRQIAPYFMCDHAKYLLGAWIPVGDAAADEKNQKQAQKYFAASAGYHKEILKNCDGLFAKSVCSFFDTWDFEKNKDEFTVDWEKVLAASNLIFASFEDGQELLEDCEIRKVWNDACPSKGKEKAGRCLVSGKTAPIARVHPVIKGVSGAQSSGAALVSFHGSAFESYGKEQGDNAPVSEYAAEAYSKALNYLLEDQEHHRTLGETTIVFWADAKENEEGYCRIFSRFMDGIVKEKIDDFHNTRLKPETKFYVLGLSSNAARISVRFFYNSTFGNVVSNINKHYDRMEIENPAYEKGRYPSFSDILYETVHKKTNNKQAQPILVGALMRSILENQPYPSALYSQIMFRIFSERTINRNRAAVIKAYMIKNHPKKADVVNSLQLREDSDYIPYILGRLFAVLEDVQRCAGSKGTLRDRYLNTASSTPALVFPKLLTLSTIHMRELASEHKKLQLEKEVETLISKLHSDFPERLSLEDQGIFMIGYYHQVQKFLKKSDLKQVV